MTEYKYDVTALGELLIDFTENGMSNQGNPLLEANPGGAPCNVLSMLTRLGHKTSFIGKVGKDMFGDQLENAVREVGISTEGLIRDDEIHTTLAFVHTYPGGDRDFSFYRNPGADMMLSVNDVKPEMIKSSRIFHFGTLSMTDDVCREATKYALDIAKEAGCLISFDPNIREPLWKSMDTCKEMVEYGINKCDILKISDNEIQWLTGREDFEEGVAAIREKYHPMLILVSLGPNGSLAFAGDRKAFIPAYLRDDTIETTGAGDTFCACVLHYALEHNIDKAKAELSEEEFRKAEMFTEDAMKEMLNFANAAASIVTTRKGALRVMPTKDEVVKALR